MKKETSNGIFTEWQVQELAASSTTNYHNEGSDTATAAATPTSRVGNYHQISKKVFATSGTLDAVETAGREREHNYQKVLKSLELRRDVEKMIGDTDVARSASDPRKSASLSCWITNGSVGGGSGAFATGDGSDAITNGDDRALSLGLIEDAQQDAWTDGGNPRLMVMSAANKANFSDLSAAATNNVVSNQVNMTQAKEVTFIGSTSIFLGDFGEVSATPSRQLGNDRIFLIDPDFVSLCTLNGRNFLEEDLAKVGDATESHVLIEWALKPTAPKAHAMILDLSGS